MEPNRPLPGLDFRPAEDYIIQSLDELHILAKPLRLRVLDALIAEPLTVTQLGEKLGISSKKLYYHVGELARYGLVRLVHTEVQSGIQLKYYRAIAAYYYLTADILHSDRAAANSGASGEFLGLLLESSAAALRQSAADGIIDNNREAFIVSRRQMRLSGTQATALRDFLKSQEHEVLQHDDPNGELAMTYVFALFPVSGNHGKE